MARPVSNRVNFAQLRMFASEERPWGILSRPSQFRPLHLLVPLPRSPDRRNHGAWPTVSAITLVGGQRRYDTSVVKCGSTSSEPPR